MTSIHRTRGAALGSRAPRLIAVLAIGAAVALGTTGCSMISSYATTIPYSAAEGVNVHGAGPLEVRNAFIVATADGPKGNFVAAIINQTDKSETLHMEFGEGSSAIEKTIKVPANSVVSLGTEDTDRSCSGASTPCPVPTSPATSSPAMPRACSSRFPCSTAS